MSIQLKRLKSGFAMSVLGLGTWGMGGKHERDSENDDERDIRAIREAIKLGIIHIDTAEVYAEGHAEELVGEAIKGLDRSKLFTVSKVAEPHLHSDDVLRSCEASLRRLGTTYLDLYLIHWWSDTAPLEETIRALDLLVDRGLVKNIGVSNFGKERLAEASKYSRHKIVCDQVHYNIEVREVESKGLLSYCQEHDLFLSAWRPLGEGALLKNPPEVIWEMSKKYQKTPAQIAINWLVSQKNVVTLVKASDLDHLREDLGGAGWQMAEGDILRIRQEYPNQRFESDIGPLD